MAITTVQPAKMQQMIRGTDRQIFSASEDSAMMKQIQATHSPDGREVSVRPILLVIDEILHRAAPDIDGVINGTHHAQIDALENKATMSGFDDILEVLAYIIDKVSCELSCKCSDGADAHATTMTTLNMLSSYTWEAKVVISLAAFSVNYGEFWLVSQLYATNPLAKSVALLKQLPNIIEHSHFLKSRFDAINNLIKAMFDVTKCIVEFTELPSQYISAETHPMSTAMAHIPTAVYWTIRSTVACSSQITSLLGMSYEHITATTEAWELSSLAHKVQNIHNHLKGQLDVCYQHIDEKRHDEYFHKLMRLFEAPHLDNIRILKALIDNKDDKLPLVDGTTKTRVNVEVLRRKTVLLLISDLEIHPEELLILTNIYHESRRRPELQYEVVWIPILDRRVPLDEGRKHEFEQLKSMMPWYTMHHPSLVEPAVTKYIKEVWHFEKKMILVALDPQGKVSSQNALHMMWIWGYLAYPFTSTKEEELWRAETWGLQLLVDGIDPSILEWIAQGKYICLYGGEDLAWIRRFTTTAKGVALAAGISLEMVYVGKSSSSRERVRRIVSTVTTENLSHTWPDLTSIWYFWVRLESMWYSKMQHKKTIQNDLIMKEVMTMLSFAGSDEGWALISRGSAELASGKADTFLGSLSAFDKWEENAKRIGFVPALNDQLQQIHTADHCNRLILPGIHGDINEMVVCPECGRPMEMFSMYRCCQE